MCAASVRGDFSAGIIHRIVLRGGWRHGKSGRSAQIALTSVSHDLAELRTHPIGTLSEGIEGPPRPFSRLPIVGSLRIRPPRSLVCAASRTRPPLRRPTSPRGTASHPTAWPSRTSVHVFSFQTRTRLYPLTAASLALGLETMACGVCNRRQCARNIVRQAQDQSNRETFLGANATPGSWVRCILKEALTGVVRASRQTSRLVLPLSFPHGSRRQSANLQACVTDCIGDFSADLFAIIDLADRANHLSARHLAAPSPPCIVP